MDLVRHVINCCEATGFLRRFDHESIKYISLEYCYLLLIFTFEKVKLFRSMNRVFNFCNNETVKQCLCDDNCDV